MSHEVEVTGIDPIKLIKEAYALSKPQGLGFMHYESGPLSEDEARLCMDPDGTIHMDYVHGRSCKFNTFKRDRKFFMRNPWYDHTDAQFAELCKRVGLTALGLDKHGAACNCSACRQKRGEEVLPIQN